MHFTINRMSLVKALNKLKAAIPSKSQHLQDIFYHVLVQASDSGITLTATNYDMRVSIRIVESILVLEDGACAVNYAQLVAALAAFPRKADLLIRQEEQGLVITFGLLAQTVEGCEASAFPSSRAVPEVGATFEEEEYDSYSGHGSAEPGQPSKYTYQVLQVHMQRLVMQQDTLLALVEKVAFAAATDDSRPVMMAVYTQLQDDVLSLVAADGFRLAEHRARVAGAGSWERGVPIWAKYLVRGLQLMPEGTQISMECYAITKQLVKRNGHQVTGKDPFVEFVLVRLVGDHEVVEMRPIVGTYPNYQSVIPRQATTQVTCETVALLAALEEIAPIVKEAGNKSVWYIERDAIRVEVRRDEHSEPDSRRVPAVITGDAIRIILNCAYIQATLRAIGTQRVVLELARWDKPGVFRPEGDDQTRYVVMPMTLDR